MQEQRATVAQKAGQFYQTEKDTFVMENVFPNVYKSKQLRQMSFKHIKQFSLVYVSTNNILEISLLKEILILQSYSAQCLNYYYNLFWFLSLTHHRGI